MCFAMNAQNQAFKYLREASSQKKHAALVQVAYKEASFEEEEMSYYLNTEVKE